MAFIYLSACRCGTRHKHHSGRWVITHLLALINLHNLTSCITYNCYCHIKAPHYKDQWVFKSASVKGDCRWWTTSRTDDCCSVVPNIAHDFYSEGYNNIYFITLIASVIHCTMNIMQKRIVEMSYVVHRKDRTTESPLCRRRELIKSLFTCMEKKECPTVCFQIHRRGIWQYEDKSFASHHMFNPVNILR